MSNPYKIEGFHRGVIENNNDPLMQGRCQIRILGLHSPKLVEMPTDRLPWAEQANSIFSGHVQGTGINSIPLNGSWVWVFFDKGEITKPVYFATSVGGNYSKMPTPTLGFRDSYLYEESDYSFPNSTKMKETDNDINRLAKAKQNGDLKDTPHERIQNNLMSDSSSGGITGSVEIKEPISTSDKSSYPNNNVIQTRAGHVIELDDTLQNERIRIYHPSGTYEEIKLNGDKVSRNEKDYYILTKEDLNEIVEGQVKRYVEKGITEHIANGDMNLKVNGNVNWEISGTVTWNVGSQINMTSGSTMTVDNGGNYTHTAPQIHLNP